MNNAMLSDIGISLEDPNHGQPLLQQKEADLMNIIQSLVEVESSQAWQKLKVKVFDGLVQNLENLKNAESSKKEIDVAEIHRLNGQLTWARKYSDLSKLISAYKLELVNVKRQLKN